MGEGDSQMVDDVVYDRIVGDEGYDLHLGSADRTGEWIDLVAKIGCSLVNGNPRE